MMAVVLAMASAKAVAGLRRRRGGVCGGVRTVDVVTFVLLSGLFVVVAASAHWQLW